MGKHSSADQKLHISPQLQPRVGPLKQKHIPGAAPMPQAPPKGTNANNQFR